MVLVFILKQAMRDLVCDASLHGSLFNHVKNFLGRIGGFDYAKERGQDLSCRGASARVVLKHVADQNVDVLARARNLGVHPGVVLSGHLAILITVERRLPSIHHLIKHDPKREDVVCFQTEPFASPNFRCDKAASASPLTLILATSKAQVDNAGEASILFAMHHDVVGFQIHVDVPFGVQCAHTQRGLIKQSLHEGDAVWLPQAFPADALAAGTVCRVEAFLQQMEEITGSHEGHHDPKAFWRHYMVGCTDSGDAVLYHRARHASHGLYFAKILELRTYVVMILLQDQVLHSNEEVG
mmetsp:Transcript_18294/g.42825  ORF Transcript_18294/g.42825 Transcript_18294/m.42825 type:complete len:297 (-) Transcript_18294:416-1306(-)